MLCYDSKFLVQLGAVISANLGIFCYGMHYGWPSPSIPQLLASGALTGEQGSWLSVMPSAGCMLGAPLSALAADRLGRQRTILLAALPILVAWLAVAAAPASLPVLMGSRLLTGLSGSTLFTVLPMFMGEVCEPKTRGRLAILLTAMWNLGVLTVYCLGPFLSIRAVALTASLAPLLFLATFCWLPETPYFLVLRGRPDAARRALQCYRAGRSSEEEFQEVVRGSQPSPDAPSYWSLLRPPNKTATLLVFGVTAVQELSGRSAFQFYSQTIFDQAEAGIQPHVSAMVFSLVQLLSVFPASLVIDRFGRRPLLIVSCLASSLCLVSEGLYFYLKLNSGLSMARFGPLAVLVMMLFVVTFTLGLGVVPMVLAGELFTLGVKSRGLCAVDIFSSFLSIVVSKVFQAASDSVGIYVPFWIFASLCLCGTLFIVLLVPETKKKSLGEIQTAMQAMGQTTQTKTGAA